MQCPFCYIPFDKKKIDFEKLKKILIKSKLLGIKTVTFGGGDPLIYPEFREILKISRQMGFFVHVDTNGICISEKDLSLIKETVDLIGLPLDGSTPEMVDLMRKSTVNNYTKVLDLINKLQNSSTKIKINTVASKINQSNLFDLFLMLSKLKIDRWSLYQYVPLLGSKEVINSYTLSKKDFIFLINKINKNKFDFVFEPSSIEERHKTYIFTSPNGDAYIHDPENHNKYLSIGDFLENNWHENVKKTNINTVREKAKTRYS
jgi:MoaA/NifB/PqqE/SkfB family radical SAM enzyme